MRTFRTILAILLIPVGVLAAPIPKDKGKSTAELLTGTWKLTGGTNGPFPENRLLLTFTANGKVILKQNVGGRTEYLREGTYKLEGKQIHYEVTTPGSEKKETLTIKKIDEKELSFVDPDDILEEFQRVPDAKK